MFSCLSSLPDFTTNNSLYSGFFWESQKRTWAIPRLLHVLRAT